jgi:SAM-dependent methyltransferase
MSSGASIDVEDGGALPFPGGELAYRVAGTADREWFFKSGRQSSEDIKNGLAAIGSRPQDCERILDFGCGCGRVLLWLKDFAATTALYGTDIDSTAIDWARSHVPYAKFIVNQPLPPTEFPDAFFDFVYCHSVFTHIDEAYQDAWLGELQRVVKPGGRLLLSVSGEYAFQQLEKTWRSRGADSSALRAARDLKGLLFIKDDNWTGGPFPDFYHTTFHTPAYVFAHWSRYFRIRAYIPQGSIAFQDYVLLERVAPDELAEALARPSTASDEAIYQIAALLARGPSFEYPGRFGRLSTLARKAIRRILRHHSSYEHEVHSAVVDALRGLEITHRDLLDKVRQQHERISQLEKHTAR